MTTQPRRIDVDANDVDKYGRFSDSEYDVIYSTRADLPFYLAVADRYSGPILEVACGTGRILLPTARRGFDIVGLDLSTRRLRICADRLAREAQDVQNRVELYYADMTDFDLNRRFSLITTPFRGLQDLIKASQWREAFCRFHAHLVPGGRLVVDVFNPWIQFLSDEVPSLKKEDGVVEHEGKRISLSYRVLERDYFAQTQKVEETIEVAPIAEAASPETQVRVFETRYAFRWEVQYLLELTGFEIEEVYGNYDFSPLGKTYPGELLIVARRPK